MAFEIGTASHAADLLLKLEKFLTTNPTLVAAGQQWESLKDNIIEPYNNNYDLNALGNFALQRCFVGRGMDGQDRIYVPMELYISKTTQAYNLISHLARTWTPSKPIGKQYTQSESSYAVLPLWEKPIQYWFFANGRRFIIVSKIGLMYTSMYCGFVLPSGTDREYPYPLLLAGVHTRSTGTRAFTDSETNGSFWIPVKYSDNSKIGSSASIISPENRIIYGRTNARGSQYEPSEMFVLKPYNTELDIGKTLDRQYVLMPIEIVQTKSVFNLLGWYDGVFFVSGYENSPENILTVNGAKYICFPSAIGSNLLDWCAIKME